jgi:exopolysaccharide biosynthesis protein
MLRKLPLVGIVIPLCSTLWAAPLKAESSVSEGHWTHLSDPHPISTGSGANYYDFQLDGGSHAHLVVVETHSDKWRIQPLLSESCTAPTSAIAADKHAGAATNGGYFNLKDGAQSTSYVVVDGVTVADPTKNGALMNNPKLKPFMERILNRSEVRFMINASGKKEIQITRHTVKVSKGWKLVDSLQAGPQLLPTVTAIDEAFIRSNANGTETDSISARKPAARTAFGITADGYAMMLCVAGKGQDPESCGITLEELSNLMRRLGCVQAINLDGGASTTMCVRLTGNGDELKTVCGKNPETLVRSILMLKKR